MQLARHRTQPLSNPDQRIKKIMHWERLPYYQELINFHARIFTRARSNLLHYSCSYVISRETPHALKLTNMSSKSNSIAMWWHAVTRTLPTELFRENFRNTFHRMDSDRHYQIITWMNKWFRGKTWPSSPPMFQSLSLRSTKSATGREQTIFDHDRDSTHTVKIVPVDVEELRNIVGWIHGKRTTFVESIFLVPYLSSPGSTELENTIRKKRFDKYM